MRTTAFAIPVAIPVAALATACSGSVEPVTQEPAATSSAAVSTAPEGFPVHPVPGDAVVELASPDWLAAGDDGVWVRLDSGQVVQLDGATGEPTTTVEVGGDTCQGLGAGLERVWSCAGSDVVGIDPATGRVESTFPVAKAFSQGHLVTADGLLWVLTGDGSTLLGLDPVSGTEEARVGLGARGTDLAAGDAGLWVVSQLDGQAIRVDTEAGAVDVRVDGLDEPTVAAVTEQVWVSGGATVRIDPAGGRAVISSDIGSGRDGGLAIGEDAVWVRSADRFLVALDPETAEPIAGYSAPDVTSGGAVLLADGALWATAYDDSSLFRLDPLPAG